MRGISTQTLEQSLNVYYQRLTNWNTTEEKRQQYLKRIDEITEELNKRENK
jgi:proline dehydrogenase